MLSRLLLILLLAAPIARHSGAPGSVNPSAGSLRDIENKLESIGQKLDSNDTSSRLAALEKAVQDLKAASPWTILLPSIIAALSALAGIGVGGWGQSRLQQARLAHDERIATAKATQDRELAENQAKLQIGSAVVDWQLKQLSLLYGPIRALLGQSLGLYRQMNRVLEHSDGTRFRFMEGGTLSSQNAEDGKEFQIKTTSGWERFRTVMHLEEVYGCGHGVETYFDEIVSIGSRVVTIIEQNAGYARPEEEELMLVFAKYLAHFAVLNHVHLAAKANLKRSQRPAASDHEGGAEKLRVEISAVFPTELHDLINAGFVAITGDIEQWRLKALT